ncbi:MAG: S9 family peptidase [Acidobacteriota bacterium]
MKHALLAWFLLCLVPAVSLPGTSQWTPELAMTVRTVGEVVPSPDGQLAAYTQTWAVMAGEKSEMVTQVFLARFGERAKPVQLTQGEKSCVSPSFSPDGKWVYFLSERSGTPNLWRISVEGGEGQQLTDWKGTIGTYQVSPNGTWIAFTGREPDQELEKARKEKRDFRILDENPKNNGLWLVPAEPDSNSREAKRVFDAPFHIGSVEWSPDSRRIAFERRPTSDPDSWRFADLSEVEVESGKVSDLSATPAAESDPRYSPDGRYVAFVRTSHPVHWAGDGRLVLHTRASGAQHLLPATADEFGRGGNLLGWASDSSRLYFTETRGTQNGLFAMPLQGNPETLYLPSQGTVSSYGSGVRLNRGGTHVGLAWETSNLAPEAYLLPLSGGPPRPVSQANSALPDLAIGETRRIEWKAPDGLGIEGLLTLPTGYRPGERYPMVLIIHGGPMGVFTETFLGRPGLYSEASFSARGYVVLRANVRGSSGYGRAFRMANISDWGGMDYQDLMAGVDSVIAQGIAAPRKMAVMGWSYGGYMTSWVIGHTDRFQAAAVGAGVTNLWSFTGTADIPSFLPDYFSGEPWERFEAYRRHSPMSYVQQMKTPTLILHGEADERVPISQGYELYNALKRRGVETKMVVYPRTPHGVQEPKFLLDVMQRHLDWAGQYLSTQ